MNGFLTWIRFLTPFTPPALSGYAASATTITTVAQPPRRVSLRSEVLTLLDLNPNSFAPTRMDRNIDLHRRARADVPLDHRSYSNPFAGDPSQGPINARTFDKPLAILTL